MYFHPGRFTSCRHLMNVACSGTEQWAAIPQCSFICLIFTQYYYQVKKCVVNLAKQNYYCFCLAWFTGIVQRCPPSPAPSSGTTSIMSAPSAFSLPPSRDHQLISTSLQHAAECCLHGVGGGGDIARANADFIGSLNKLKDVSDVT